MKADQFRELPKAELEIQAQELAGQVWRLRFQAATGQTEGLKKLRSLRKDIARAKTVLRERELKETRGE